MVFTFLGASLQTGTLYAQCPAVTLTPTAWGAASGSATFSAGTYTLNSSGDFSVSQTSDNGYADLMNWAGDGQIQARVSGLSGSVSANTMVGVFIRKDASAGADGGLLWLQRPTGNLYTFADRTGGGPLQEPQAGVSVSIPYWLRLQNSQGVLLPAISSDGTNWTLLSSHDLSSTLGKGTTLVYGLFVWSGNASQSVTAAFDNLCVSQVTPFPTSTPTSTSTFTTTPTMTPTRTPTSSPTVTQTSTSTSSPTLTPTVTPSTIATPTPPPGVKVWPNPFTPNLSPNDRTHFLLPTGHGAGRLIIADLRRRTVRTLDFQPGSDVQWDGRDDSGTVVASGVYLYLVESDGLVGRGTITVMR